MAWLKQKTVAQVARKKSKDFHRRDAEDAKKNLKSASSTSSAMLLRLFDLVYMALPVHVSPRTLMWPACIAFVLLCVLCVSAVDSFRSPTPTIC
jgi:hypothetical protein